jgi:hypothetical protein
MKLFNLIFEDFTFKPRNIKLFFENLIKRIFQYENKIISLYKELDKFLEEDDFNERRSKEQYFNNIFLNIVSYDFEDIKYRIANFKKTINANNEHLTDKIQYLYSAIKTNGKNINLLKSIIQELKFFLEDNQVLFEFSTKVLSNLEKLKNEIDDKNWILSPQIFYTVKNLVNEIDEFNKLINDFTLPKLERLMQYFNAYDEKDLQHKNIKDIETLYHATVNAKEIFQTGFKKTTVSQEVEGIGGSNKDKAGNPAVSFTADLYIAKEIARCLKEAILIAQGKIDIYDLRTMAIQAGISDIIDENWSVYSKEEKLEKLTTGEVFDYYRYYLAYSSRYDPVFFDSDNLMNVLKNKSVDNVGILVCKVDMTDKNIKYLESMEEFRVNPNSVISIEKILQ